MRSLRWRALAFLLLSLPALTQQFDPKLYQETHWRMIGPFRGGRTVGIAGIPDQPNVAYMTVNNGGVWKSTDYGRVWTPIFDDQPTQSIGAIAIAPSDPNVIYVGTGEGLRRPDLATGDGVYRSNDGGKTWKHLGLRDAQQIGAIVVHPTDPNKIWVAALGHPYGPNPERGIYRSTDGGETYQRVLYKDEDTGGIDLQMDPTNPQVIYASMWTSRRPPWTTGGSYDAEGSGLYKTTDGGDHWTQITDGLPTWEKDKAGRIGIAIAPSDPKRMYLNIDLALGNKCAIYRSDDAGASWSAVSTENRVCGRASDFAWVRVHPTKPDVIYACNTALYRSEDGGKTFVAIKGAPGGDDYHSIWINPKNPDIFLVGADQGATISVNGGKTWSSWYNQPTAQFYHVRTDNQFPYWVYGGQQESGSIAVKSRGDYGFISSERDTFLPAVEEYGYVEPDPLDPNIIYGPKGSRHDRRTSQTQDITPFVLRSPKYRFNRTAPMLFHHADPKQLLMGSNVLFKTTNGGQSWDVISPDLTREKPGSPANLGKFVESDPAKGVHRGVIYSIGPSFKDPNTIWVGTDDGLVHVTRDGGKNWQNITPPELTPWSKISQIEASHFDEQTCYVSVSRFRLDDLHAYIYRTHDGGKSWKKITNGIPDNAAVNAVREDPVRKGLLYAATERAIWVSFDDGENWQSLQMNLPYTSMRDIVVHNDDLVVGTHGRSFWILDNLTPLRQLDTKVSASDGYLFKPQVSYRLRRSTSPDTPIPPDEPMGENPPDGAMIDYWLKSDAAGPVQLEIMDAAGKLVRRYSSDDKLEQPKDDPRFPVPAYWMLKPMAVATSAGMHRFVWDLRYPAPETEEQDYPISAVPGRTPREPLGPLALPGNYTVRLTAGGKTYSQPLTLKVDPRVKASVADLTLQHQLSLQISDGITRSHRALQRIADDQQKLAVAKMDAAAAQAEQRKLDLLEKGDATRPDPIGNGLARTHTQLISVLGTLQSADAAPTSQALAMAKQLMQALETQLKQLP